MTLPDFLKLHEFCLMMSDIGRESLEKEREKAKAQAEANRSK